MRTKTGLTDDPDVFDPAVAIGQAEQEALGCFALPGRRVVGDYGPLRKIKIKVTFRNSATGAEIAGTYDAEPFALVPAGLSGDPTGARPAVEKLGEVTTQPSEEPIEVAVARHEVFGVRLTNISAPTATHVYCTVSEWG